MSKGPEFNNIESITVTVKGKDGLEESITLGAEEAFEMTKSVMYQTISNAIGSPAKHLMNKANCRELPDNDFFKDLKDGKITEKELHDVRFYNWSDSRILVGDDKEYPFKGTKEEVEEMRKLALHYLRSLNSIKYIDENRNW